MRTLPNGPRGQFLAVGIAVLSLLAIWIAVIDPALGLYAERSERLSTRTALAARMERLAVQKASLEARVSQLGSAGAAPHLLDGRTDAVAAAALQNIMQDTANSVGASLTSVESLPAEAATGGARRIGIKLSLSASWPIIVDFLDASGRASTAISVDDLHVHNQAGVQNGQQLLDAGFNVYAYATAGGDKAP